MAKTMSKDSQILLNILGIQEKMDNIFGKYEEISDVSKEEKDVSLLSFYIIKLFMLRKFFSGKTKKALHIFDDFTYDLFSRHLASCYPLMSDKEIVNFARALCDDDARLEINDRYVVCIADSEKYVKE